jgi:hypothetical protein
MEKGFYKYDGVNLYFAPNKVEHKEYVLEIEKKDEYIFPVYEWYYFETEREAKEYLNFVELSQEEPITETQPFPTE